MGRQAFVTRLALGRSALQPLSPEGDSTQDHDSTRQQSSEPTERLTDDCLPNQQPIDPGDPKDGSATVISSNYLQRYDKKGYPRNPASRALKRRWRHAVNDVLATVGVCVAKGQQPMMSHPPRDESKIEAVYVENECGIYIGAVDSVVGIAAIYWTKALRQRLETFRFYSGIPLVQIMKIERKHYGGLSFFFTGLCSSFAFVVLETGIDWAIENAFEALKRLAAPTADTQPSKARLGLLDFAEMMTKMMMVTLITPLEIYATLQRLGLLSPWPLLPYPQTFLSGLSAVWHTLPNLPTENTLNSILSYHKALALSPLAILWFSRNIGVGSKLFRYVWAALPKPTRPDIYSVEGTRDAGLDFSSIPGLIDPDDQRSGLVATTFSDQLALDLQSVGWKGQSIYDQCAGILEWVVSGFYRDTGMIGSVDDLAQESDLSVPVPLTGLRSVEFESFNPVPLLDLVDFESVPHTATSATAEEGQRQEEAELHVNQRPDPQSDGARTTENGSNQRVANTENLSTQNPEPHTQQPLRIVLPTADAEHQQRRPPLSPPPLPHPPLHQHLHHPQSISTHNPPNHFSPPSSTPSTPSSPATPSPQPDSITTTPLPSLPASPRPIELIPNNDGIVHVNLTLPAPIHSIAISSSTAAAAATYHPITATLPPTISLPAFSTYNPFRPRRIRAARPYERHVPSVVGPEHRVTALSAHPTESIAQRLSTLLGGLLLVPVEALFVRSVAMAFLSSSGSGSGSGPGGGGGTAVREAAAARWRGEVYPLGRWFGPGLRGGGGLDGAGDYVGKIFLAHALEAGAGFLSWQLGMGVVWWIGRRWCGWGRVAALG